MFGWICKRKKTIVNLFVFFPPFHIFFYHVSALHVSFLTWVTLSAVRPSALTHISHQAHSHAHTHTYVHLTLLLMHIFSFTTNLLSFCHTFTRTHTHAHTPLVAISATLLTGANQSYNTFIISTPPQAPSCWVKSHLGLFGCFTALEIRNYITDMGGPHPVGSSHWQLDTKQTRCELCCTLQKKKQLSICSINSRLFMKQR